MASKYWESIYPINKKKPLIIKEVTYKYIAEKNLNFVIWILDSKGRVNYISCFEPILGIFPSQSLALFELSEEYLDKTFRHFILNNNWDDTTDKKVLFHFKQALIQHFT